MTNQNETRTCDPRATLKKVARATFVLVLLLLATPTAASDWRSSAERTIENCGRIEPMIAMRECLRRAADNMRTIYDALHLQRLDELKARNPSDYDGPASIQRWLIEANRSRERWRALERSECNAMVEANLYGGNAQDGASSICRLRLWALAADLAMGRY